MSSVNASTLTGSLSLPVVNKLKSLEKSTKPGTSERAIAALPVIAELEEDLDTVLNCISINGVLMMCRLNNPKIPSSSRLKALHQRFKDRLRDEPKFMRLMVDNLPAIALRYESTNPIEIIGDEEFMNLLTK